MKSPTRSIWHSLHFFPCRWRYQYLLLCSTWYTFFPCRWRYPTAVVSTAVLYLVQQYRYYTHDGHANLIHSTWNTLTCSYRYRYVVCVVHTMSALVCLEVANSIAALLTAHCPFVEKFQLIILKFSQMFIITCA